MYFEAAISNSISHEVITYTRKMLEMGDEQTGNDDHVLQYLMNRIMLPSPR